MTPVSGAAPTLELHGVTASPWGAPLLQGIDMSLRPGEIVAMVGPNGAGKSSLLQLMAGDLRSEIGSVSLAGRPVRDWHARERACRLAYLPQMSLLNFPYTVEEVALLGRIPHATGRDADQTILQDALAATDTLSLRDRLYTQLSGGEKQRTQLARVFVQVDAGASLEGQLLLLDEPTSALDLAHQQTILVAVRKLADRGCAVVLALHDLNIASSVAGRILVLDRGRPAALGTPQEVLTAGLLRSVFGVAAIISRHPDRGFPLVTPDYGTAP